MVSPPSNKGITILEVVIAAALAALLAATLSPIFTASSRAWDKDRKMKEMIQRSRDAMDLMVYELKKTNAVIDGTSANLSTTAALDSSYVVFGTSGEEFYLDDKNSGYSTGGGGTWKQETKTGGFAGDYDVTSAGYASYSYSFATMLPGDYDIYAYYLPTAAVMRLNVFDDGNLDYSTTYDQSGNRFATTATGSSWDQLNRSAPVTRTSIDYPNGLTGRQGVIGISRTSGTANGHTDGIKFVYRGYRHKIFFFSASQNKITYGSDAFGFAGLANNPTLLNNVQPIGSTPLFTYYQADGVTPAANANDAALVRIQFQVFDPNGSAYPYPMRAMAEIRTSGSVGGMGSGRKIVLNEINVQTPNKTLGFDNFDGTVSNMDNDNYGWATETATKDYGWLSMLENFDDGEAAPPAGWFDGSRGTWLTEVDATAPKPAGNRVYSGTGSGGTDQRSNQYFYESSENFKWEFQFRVAARGNFIADQLGGNNKCATFGVELRAQTPTTDNRNIVYVEFLRKGATCAGGTAYVRVAKYEGGSDQAISGDIASLNAYDDGNWHYATVRDMWGKISVSLDGATYINGQIYNSGAKQITNTNLVPRYKAIFAWSTTHVHFDDLKIMSYDFKPIAYLTNFDGTYNDWYSFVPAGSPGACGWAAGAITSGPGAAYSGTNASATNPAGNYNQNCDEEWYHRAAVNMQSSLLRFSFPFIHFFSWQDFPAAQTADCATAERGDSTTTRYYVNETNVFPLDVNRLVITAALNGFSVPPNSYDAACTNASPLMNGRRSWTNNHQPEWTEITYPIPENDTSTDFRVTFPFAADNTATVAAGHYVDDASVYPGGEWERESTPTGPGTCASGSYCWGTINNGNYSNYQNDAFETPTVITPAWTNTVTLSWVQWRDFESATTFYDGGFAEYSSDNGATWVQFDDLQLSVGYDPCVLGSDPDPASPTYCTIPDLVNGCNGMSTFCNELQGYNGWSFDDQTWVKVSATLTGTEYANKEMKFRFRFASDNSNAARGWFIDDVKVTASPQTSYDWLELYNPTPYSVDVSNWRLMMEHSYQDAPNPYDIISGDAANGSGSAVIGPYGYALIAANTPAGSTNVYDGIFFTVPAESSQARRLTIDDNVFGTLGLRNKFGKIQLQDNNGNLVDEVDYNLAFYDDMEGYGGSNPMYEQERYSVQQWANATHWAIGTPVNGSGPGIDHTRNAAGTGYTWLLCTDPANTTCEDYNNGEETGLIPPSFDLTGSTASNPPYMEFYFWNNVDNNNRRDGMLVEVSTQGGSDFVQDPANPDTIQLAGSSLNPGYYSRTINQASNVLNGLYAYSRDIKTWTLITGNLSAYAGQVINIRFMFGADNGTSAGGPYLDDIAVYYDWANLNTNWDGVTPVLTNTIERKSWKGNSNSAANWRASLAPYNAAPTVGTPNQQNSVAQ